MLGRVARFASCDSSSDSDEDPPAPPSKRAATAMLISDARFGTPEPSSDEETDRMGQRGGPRHRKDIERCELMVDTAPAVLTEWKCPSSCANAKRKLGCVSAMLTSVEHDGSAKSLMRHLKDNWYTRNALTPAERIESLRDIAAPVAGGIQTYRGIQICDKFLLYLTGATAYGLIQARKPSKPDGRSASVKSGHRGESAAVWIREFTLLYGCNSPTKENHWYLGIARLKESLYVDYSLYCEAAGEVPVTIGYFTKIFSERYGLHGSSGMRICAKAATETGKCGPCHLYHSKQRIGTARDRAQAKADWDRHLREVRHGRDLYARAIACAKQSWAYLSQEQGSTPSVLLQPGVLLTDAADAASKWSTRLPKLPKGMAGVLGLGHIEFKITTVLQHGSGIKQFFISPPWVVSDSNLQTTIFYDYALPHMLERFADAGVVPPKKLHRQTDGGPDEKCAVQFTCNQLLHDHGIFPGGVDHDNLHSAHSHFDVDKEHAHLNAGLMRAGGAFSLRRLLSHINNKPGCRAVFLPFVWDYKRFYRQCKNSAAVNYREPLNHRFNNVGYSCRSCSYYNREYEVKGRLFDPSKLDIASGIHRAPNWNQCADDTSAADTAAKSFRSSIATILKKIDGFSDATLHILGYPTGTEGRIQAKAEWIELWKASPSGREEVFPGCGTNPTALSTAPLPPHPHPVYERVRALRTANCGPGTLPELPVPTRAEYDAPTRVVSVLPEHAAAGVLQAVSVDPSIIKNGEWRLAFHSDPPYIFVVRITSLGEESNPQVYGTLLESEDTPGDATIRVLWYTPQVNEGELDAAGWLRALENRECVADGTTVAPPFSAAVQPWMPFGNNASFLRPGEVGPVVKLTKGKRLTRSRNGDALYMAVLYHLGGLGEIPGFNIDRD